MLMNVDNPLLKHVVSQVHPDPRTRMRAHLNIGLRSIMSFVVEVTPQLVGVFEVAKGILREEVKKGPNTISVSLTHFHIQSLPKNPNMIAVATPTQRSIDCMLEFEASMFKVPET